MKCLRSKVKEVNHKSDDRFTTGKKNSSFPARFRGRKCCCFVMMAYA